MNSSKWKQFYIQTLIFTSLIFAFTGCASNRVQTKPYSPEKTMHYSQLKSYDETRNLNGYVFYVNEGETIPLKLSMEADFMDFKQDQIDIVAKQKLYFMIEMPENLSADELSKLNKLNARSFSKMSNAQRADFLKDYMLYVSKDAIHWAPLFGSRAYRNVLGFKAGLLSFAILANTADGLGASLDIRTVK
ncbi:MAG: hypothetical protein ABIK92_03500 [Pseudomonadota bacterium]